MKIENKEKFIETSNEIPTNIKRRQFKKNNDKDLNLNKHDKKNAEKDIQNEISKFLELNDP